MSFDKRSGVQVAIIGSGVGGLSFAINLKRQLKCDDFVIFEKAHDVGGTWRDHTYPGCASDIPTHWYSLSTELNPNWSKTHVEQPEIEAYWQGLSRKWDLYSNLVTFAEVTRVDWDAARSLYHVEWTDVRTGVKSQTTAKIVISAVGVLFSPTLPEIKGISDFSGDMFHSARWNNAVELKNKRVGVIGNGSSAAQFIPHLVKEKSTHVVNFCRTPTWFVPGVRHDYTDLHKWIFANIPFVMRIYRAWILYRFDLLFTYFQDIKVRARWTSKFIKLIKKRAPKEYHDKLVPTYPPGCKRAVIAAGYLESLGNPNVELNWDGIEEIQEKGILTKKGELIPLDVLIFATGYTRNKYPIPIKGAKGQLLTEYFDEKDGPYAYRGMAIPNFPNFYMLGGPNTTTGTGSIIFVEECQSNYLMPLVEPVIKGQALSFCVKEKVCDEYNAHIQSKINSSLYDQCKAAYHSDRKGRNVAIFPFPQSIYWWYTAWVKWGDYTATGAAKWKRSMFIKRLLRLAGMLAVATSLAVRYRHPGLITSYVGLGLDLARTHSTRLLGSVV